MLAVPLVRLMAVAMVPAFLPDGAILVIAEQRAGDDSTVGLAVIDVDNGASRAWVGGYWNEQHMLASAGD